MRRQRRESEFTEFYAARRLPLRRTAYLIVRDWHTAEDLTQQSMVKLYAAWPRVRSETLDAFARRIVVNECLSHLRRRRDIPVDHVPVVDQWGPEPAVLDLGAALGLLPPRQRAVIALRFLDDLSVADVAQVLDVSDGTVRARPPGLSSPSAPTFLHSS